MNRQYIGARYVPVYFNNGGSAEWVSGIGYEPLTIVTYLGRTYTSTKPVPSNIGSPNENPTYWVESGDTQTINNLINAIEEVDGKVDDLKDDTDDKFDEVDNAIDELEDEVDEINAKIGSGKYIFVGDSYAVMNVGWLTKLVTKLGLTSSDYYNACVNGSSFISTNSSLNWKSIVTSVVNGLTDAEKNSISDVVCIGGINDSVPYTVIPDCANDNNALVYTVERINEFAEYISNTLPNAKISLFYVGNTEEGLDTQGQRYYSNIIRGICAWNNASYKNLKVYNGSENILHVYTLMSADGIHPNENGCEMIAKFVVSALNGGTGVELIDTFNTITINPNPTPASGSQTLYVNGDFKYTIINNNVNLFVTGGLSFYNDDVPITEGAEVKIGEFSNKEIIHGKRVEIPCTGWYTPTGSQSGGISMPSTTLIIDKGDLYVKFWKITNDWTVESTIRPRWVILKVPNTTYPLVQN